MNSTPAPGTTNCSDTARFPDDRTSMFRVFINFHSGADNIGFALIFTKRFDYIYDESG